MDEHKRFLKDHKAALMVGAIALIVAVIGAFLFKYASDYWQGIIIELGGSFWDVVLVVILLGIYEYKRRKDDKIQELRRRINDFKKLDTDYGHAIIGSSLRELSEYKITNIDFRGAKLTGFRFYEDQGIESLKGSVFSDGLYLTQPLKNFTELNSADFSEVDCSKVTFGKGNLSCGTYKDCKFRAANLCEASFAGISLKWDKSAIRVNPEDWHEVVDLTKEGNPIYEQKYIPAFKDANLDKAVFDQAHFENADFREANNILNASFKEVIGIKTCLFDDGILEQLKISCKLTEKKD